MKGDRVKNCKKIWQRIANKLQMYNEIGQKRSHDEMRWSMAMSIYRHTHTRMLSTNSISEIFDWHSEDRGVVKMTVVVVVEKYALAKAVLQFFGNAELFFRNLLTLVIPVSNLLMRTLLALAHRSRHNVWKLRLFDPYDGRQRRAWPWAVPKVGWKPK